MGSIHNFRKMENVTNLMIRKKTACIFEVLVHISGLTDSLVSKKKADLCER